MQLQQTVRRSASLALLASALTPLAGLQAQNIVVNGDFGTDSLAGWGGNGGIFVVPGEFQASMGGGSSSSLFQFLTTVAGATYDISFDLDSVNALPGFDAATTFAVYFDGNLLSQRTLPEAGTGYGLFFSSVPASTDATGIFFASSTNFITFKLDNVSVTPTAVPEPAAYASLVSVAALALVAHRRRRRA